VPRQRAGLSGSADRLCGHDRCLAPSSSLLFTGPRPCP
jgi:hypothetical protein